MKLFERIPDRIEIEGKKYRLKLDYRNVIRMLYIMENEYLMPMARDYLAVRCVVKHPPKDCFVALHEIQLLLFGEPKPSGEKLTSFDQDADLIRAAFMQEYGINLFRDKLNWFEFSAFLHGLPNGSRYSDVIGIRSRPVPPPTRFNQAEREALIRAKAACALNMSDKERQQSYQKSLESVFNDMKNITKRG